MAQDDQPPIYRHMNNTDNPLRDVPEILWQFPKLSLFPTKAKFDAEYEGYTHKLIAKSGQSHVYALDHPKSSNAKKIVKYYDLSTINPTRIWQENVLVKKSKVAELRSCIL